MKRAIASYELLKSELVSPLTCVGRASAMWLRMLSVLRGLFAIVRVDLRSRGSGGGVRRSGGV